MTTRFDGLYGPYRLAQIEYHLFCPNWSGVALFNEAKLHLQMVFHPLRNQAAFGRWIRNNLCTIKAQMCLML